MTVKIRPYKRGGLEVDIMIRLPNGETYRERRKAPTDSRSAAMRWGKDRERHLLVHGPNDKSGRSDASAQEGAPTLAEFAPRYMEGYAVANRQKPSTMYMKRYHFDNFLLPMLGSKRLDEIGQEEVQLLKTRMSKLSVKSTNNLLATLSTLLKCAVEWGVLAELPVRIRHLRVPKKTMDFFDFDEFEQLVAAARELGPGVLAFVLLAGEAGLRAGEIRGLQWSSVDLDRRLLTVERAEWHGQIITPKHDKIRTVPMTARLTASLRELERGPGPFVIYTQRHARAQVRTFTHDCQRSWLSRALRDAGLRDKGPHTLRHTFCSHLAMRGAPASAIQRLAGHSSLVVTERYMHLTASALESAIRLLEAPAPVYARGAGERSGGLSAVGDRLEKGTRGR